MKSSAFKSRNGRILFVLLVVAVLCAIDAFFIEPRWIEVTHHALAGRVAQPLKIAHLTDLHTKGLGFRERRLLQRIIKGRPFEVGFECDPELYRKECPQ
jgi:predicted MPP superfamily phosphohydrolase